MMQKKHLYHFPKRMVCMALAAMMTLSTVLTGCGAESTTAHALEDDPDHTHVTEAVSDETVSLRETLADSLDDSLADQAAVISDEFWENDVPADKDAVFTSTLKTNRLLMCLNMKRVLPWILTA